MKRLIRFEIAGSVRSLLVSNQQVVSIGSSQSCQIHIDSDLIAPTELELTFLELTDTIKICRNGDNHSSECSLPHQIDVHGYSLDLSFIMPSTGLNTETKFNVTVVGASLAASSKQSVEVNSLCLLGSSADADICLNFADLLQLAIYPLSKTHARIEILDSTTPVDWIGREDENGADLTWPLLLSIGGKVTVIQLNHLDKRFIATQQANPLTQLSGLAVRADIEGNDVTITGKEFWDGRTAFLEELMSYRDFNFRN
jgi:hypothetical protein